MDFQIKPQSTTSDCELENIMFWYVRSGGGHKSKLRFSSAPLPAGCDGAEMGRAEHIPAGSADKATLTDF